MSCKASCGVVEYIQGDVVGVYNSSGTKLVTFRYDAYGNCTVSGDANFAQWCKIRYRGYYFDNETGFYWVQTRYYNPEWSRWISPDKIGYLDPESPHGINLYCYCGNDPINYVDPTGCDPILQFFMSLGSYIGMAFASIWDKEIRADMEAIGWNPFNTSETDVLNSKKVSFYKGVPVFRTNKERSGSFGMIFLSRGYYDRNGVFRPEKDPNTVKHEYGHCLQFLTMDAVSYALMIGLPSWQEWSKKDYYVRPWEITADVLGGVTRDEHTQEAVKRGFWYLFVSSLLGPLGYLFLIGEY